MGMALQLTVLAVLNHWTGGHYLLATLAALELTLLHNFVWHLHYTWPDRKESSPLMTRFARFQLSNGIVSLIGNLCLLRILVGGTRLPIILSDAIAILICSLANFGLGHAWAFAAGHA
jgi:putative flippase GtrA